MDGTAHISLDATADSYDLALAAHIAGDLVRAADLYRVALVKDASNIPAHVNLGSILFAQRDYAAALAVFETAQAVDPQSAPVQSSVGAVLNALGRIEDAAVAYRKALSLDPNCVVALNNYGDWLNTQGQHEAAVAHLVRALHLSPAHPQAWCNLATAYCALDRFAEATLAFRSSLAAKPDLWVARKNLGILLLMRGQFAYGWQEYDWRFLADNLHLRPLTTPVWDGAALDGELLICCEQGVGDHILSVSMARDLVARGVRTVWEVDPRLLTLFQRSIPEIRFLPRAAPGKPPTDAGAGVAAQYPALSLGRVFRAETSAFPGSAYLKADPARVEEIRSKLGLADGQKLVGISWRSENKTVGALKSAAFTDFAPVLNTPGVKFVSLQYGADEIGLALEGLDATNDLEGLAALISLCDAVVTVSNSTAHMAGALGVPVFVLVGAGRAKQWAWGTKETTPWYTSARMIRQRENEPWLAPISAASVHLWDLLKEI